MINLKNRMLRAAAAFAAVAFLFCAVEAAPVVSARSAIVMDADTGRVLWDENPDSKALIASTTKIMTALLIAEECDISAKVAVPEQAVGIEGSSIYLKAGEVLTVEALLYGMMLHSGNDAATVLALYCAGTLENFSRKMNDKAESLGLTNTHFANPHGLDSEENYSTARDLARLTAYAMDNPVFYNVVSTKSATFGERTFTNHNKLLWKYKGTVGVKTGYTMSAGRILVSCAERDKRRLIAVTISDPNDWHDHCAMLDYGFSVYTQTVAVRAAEVELRIPVIGGAEPVALAVLKEDYIYPLAEHESVELEYHIAEFVYPPVVMGEDAGSISILLEGKRIAKLPLYWEYTVLEGA